MRLTDLLIPVRHGSSLPQVDNSQTHTGIASVEVIFRDHKSRLLNFIRDHEVFLGAVAWFTDEEIIHELSSKKVAIVVQKEDFLRPDSQGDRNSLKAAYDLLGSYLWSKELPGIVPRLHSLGSFRIEPLRCVGNANKDRKPAFPRMHNKFLIGCDYRSAEEIHEHAEDGVVVPKSVWTGSYNITYNATNSFENVVVINDRRVATSFAKEWAQIFSLSEPLEWFSDWVAPEYWVGT